MTRPSSPSVKTVLEGTEHLSRWIRMERRGDREVAVFASTGDELDLVLAALESDGVHEGVAERFPDLTAEDLRAALEIRRRLAGRTGGQDTLVLPAGAADEPAPGPAASDVLLQCEVSPGERYEVREAIGQGGMGQVLRAFDVELRREVALKILSEEISSDPRHVRRFLEEAQASAQLEHPNIVPTYDVGRRPDGRLWFAMHLVRGRTLAEVLADLAAGRLRSRREYGLERLLQIFLKVCDGVAYAHSRGLVHRDLKPANVMLGEFGQVLVMDWGLAKVVEPARSRPGARRPRPTTSVQAMRRESDLVLTRDGEVAGTLLYMSPEQARGDSEDVDAQSDVYGLGSILYEILTLSPPFAGVPEEDIFVAIEGLEPEPPERRAPGRRIARELSAICRKALAKDKRDRYRDVVGIQEDLQRFLASEPVLAAPDNPWRRTVKWAIRHRTLSSLLGLFVFMSLLAGAVLQVQSIEAEKRRRVLAEAGQREIEARVQAKEEEALLQTQRRLAGYRANARERLGLGSRRLEEFRRAGRGDAEAIASLAAIAGEFDLARSWFDTLRKELPEDAECYDGIVQALLGMAEAACLEEGARGTPGTWVLAVRHLDAAAAADPRGRHAGRIEALAREARAIFAVEVGSDPPRVRVRVERLEGPRRQASLVETIDLEGSRRLDLGAGSYLLTFEAPGHAAARVPVHLVRGYEENRRIAIRLLAPGRIPSGFVHVPPGAFHFGEEGTWTRLEAGFLLSARELTFGEYEAFLEAQPEAARAALAPSVMVMGGGTVELLPYVRRIANWRDLPVIGVNLEQATAYARWRTEASRGGFRFRLPTEVEWEYAARGADGRPYPWGDVFDSESCNMSRTRERQFNLFALHQCLEPVGTRAADRSIFGCHDMAGNVSEWTTSSHAFGSFRTKGGSFLSPETDCRAAYFQEFPDDVAAHHIGVRLAADLQE